MRTTHHEEEDDGRPRRRRRDYEPHRGALVMMLGIGSLGAALVGVPGTCCLSGFGGIASGVLCLGLGVSALMLGGSDRRKMHARVMDPEGLSSTTAGWICGMIGTILGCLYLLCGILVLVFAFSVPRSALIAGSTG